MFSIWQGDSANPLLTPETLKYMHRQSMSFITLLMRKTSKCFVLRNGCEFHLPQEIHILQLLQISSDCSSRFSLVTWDERGRPNKVRYFMIFLQRGRKKYVNYVVWKLRLRLHLKKWAQGPCHLLLSVFASQVLVRLEKLSRQLTRFAVCEMNVPPDGSPNVACCRLSLSAEKVTVAERTECPMRPT